MKMRTLTRFLSNWLWICLDTREYCHFLRALDRVEEVQRQHLLSLVRQNAKTEYGMRHSFADVSSIEEYQQAVPLTNYEHYSSYIEDVAQGKQGVLTLDSVLSLNHRAGRRLLQSSFPIPSPSR